MAFRAVDLYLLTLASWNTDLLSAARAGIDMMRFSLLHHIFFFIKTVPDILCITQIFLIFPVTCGNISGQDSVISINNQYKSQHIQNFACDTCSEKRTDHYVSVYLKRSHSSDHLFYFRQ